MKRLLFILYFLILTVSSFAQADTGKVIKTSDTAIRSQSKPFIKQVKRHIIADTLKRDILTDTINKADSLTKTDSVKHADTVRRSADTIINAVAITPVKKPADSIYIRLLNNPFIKSATKPIYLVITDRERQSKDEIFYLLSGLLFFLAFVKLVFSKYFKNIFRLLLQPSFRQKQTREQLLQNKLPGLLLNLFFIFSASAYASFLIQYYHLAHLKFWMLLLYAVTALLILYLGKYIFLKFTGWVFDVKETTDTYIFSVYLVNKALGVIIIPFTLLIAFSPPYIISISITISFLFISLLYLYRYSISYASARKEVNISLLHFLLYIFAFEIIPLLLIYKTLLIYLDKSL